MKKLTKILFLIVALVFISAPAKAQFRMFPSVGATLTSLKFSQDLAPVSQTVGMQAGVIGELMFPGIGFGMDIGLMYNLSGAEVDFGAKPIWATDGFGKERLMMHQILIPFNLRFKYTHLNGVEDYIAPFVYGGPQFGITVAHNDCKAVEYPGGDLQLIAGFGLEIKKNWQLSASYTWGMTYAVKTRLLQDYTARTRQWTVRLSYHF